MKYSDFKIHPFADMLPPLPDEELQKLAEDIKENGQRLSILRWKDQILDGRNRLKACLLAKVDPIIKDREDIKNEEEAAKVIISMNLSRRHLSASERAAIAVELLQYVKKDSAEAPVSEKIEETPSETAESSSSASSSGTASEEEPVEKAEKKEKASAEEKTKKEEKKAKGKAIKEVAEVTGTSTTYVAAAEKIKKEDPASFEAIKRGEKTITEVKREMEDKKPKGEDELLEKAESLVSRCNKELQKMGYELISLEIKKI